MTFKISLTEKEFDKIFEMLDREFYNIGDNSLENTQYAKIVNSLFNKMVRSKNKKGSYFLWQLIDKNQEVTEENIKPEWRLKN